MSDVIDYTEALQRLAGYFALQASNPEFQKEHLAGAGETFLLEKKLATYYGKKHAISFSSATTALQALCIAYSLKGSEIVTSPFNWGGSLGPFLLHGNKLRFIAFEPESLSLSSCDLGKAFTVGTKAVLSVDYLGMPADSKRIMAFCRDRGVPYISDSAQSLGAWRDGKPAGYYADATVVSFSAGKSVFAGEGGAVVTDDAMLYEKLLSVAHHPARQKLVAGLRGYNEFTGLNGRMNPLAAIVLNATFDESLAKLLEKQEKYFQIAKMLEKAKCIVLPDFVDSAESSTWLQPVFLLRKSCRIMSVNQYCKMNALSFDAASLSNIVPVPSSSMFRKSFKGRFFCTASLKKQLGCFDTAAYVKILQYA
jgi:perosamine synthetase